MVVVLFILLLANCNYTYAQETTPCEHHELDSYEVVEKPTIHKAGKRIRHCINCDYCEEYMIPELPKILEMHEGQFNIKTNTTKTIKFRYFAPGDEIKKIYLYRKEDEKALKILSYDNTKLKIKSGNMNYVTVIVAETKSGVHDEFYVQIGDPNKNENTHTPSKGSGKISDIVKTKNESAGDSFYQTIKSRAYAYKNEVLSYDSGIKTIEIRTINDKSKKYYSAKIRTGKGEKGILYINEYYYKKLYNFDYNSLKFTASNLDFTNKDKQIFTGCKLSVAPRIYNGDVYAYYRFDEDHYNRIFPEQVAYFQKIFNNCSYKYKWKYDGHLILVKNSDYLAEPYIVQYNPDFHYITITINRDLFKKEDFTKKDMTKILKDWVKKYYKTCEHRFFQPCDSNIID